MLLTFLAKQTNKKLLFAGPCGVTSLEQKAFGRVSSKRGWRVYGSPTTMCLQTYRFKLTETKMFLFHRLVAF